MNAQEFVAAVYIDRQFLGNVITFFSITFGFYLSSIALVATSSFAIPINKLEDSRKKTRQSLLYSFVEESYRDLLINLVAILYVLFFDWVIFMELSHQAMMFTGILLGLIVLNVLVLFRQTHRLLQFILKTAKHHREQHLLGEKKSGAKSS